MNIILLSGGSGKRLWPLSNDVRSKQFIRIFRDSQGNYESMVQRVYRQIKAVDADATVTGIVEMELGDRIVGTGLVDVTDATLLVTDLNGLQRWNLHLLIHSPGGVRGTFAETNVEGSGYEVLNTGTSLYLWNGSKSGGTTIFVR